ncbi:hypothetical protein LTR09_002827 [Extremus antarcticus]|uniref:Mus7/MMS22 family-domain-containing protein n=1 Tax=Extremus antarcticus TaxID=702011 RepID=A0AAJ0GF49_9PEZI|nr:hypothetical protein LTR09_002827 [Extremus antarcticus]
MKRWQDRGEVQDSDDEDLSIEAESQRSEHVSKKPRLDTGDLAATQGHDQQSEQPLSGVREDEEAEWLRPRAVAKYGRKADATRQHLDDEAPEGLQLTGTGIESASPVSTAHSPGPPAQTFQDIKSSQSVESEELPDVDQLIGRRLGSRTTPDVVSPVSSAPSSPLSEPEQSPPPPDVEFRRSSDFSALPLPEAAPHDHNNRYDVEDLLVDDLADENFTSFVGRRGFRTRNEKQLHPYGFELAQYQKQLRDRGMRPVRVVEVSKRVDETQDSVGGGNESDHSANGAGTSSSPTPSVLGSVSGSQSLPIDHEPTTVSIPHDASSDSEEELPDVRSLLNRPNTGSIRRSTKRRKLSHVAVPVPNTRRVDDYDVFSIPPSPPPTSTDSAAAPETRPAPAVFRMPRGLTPAPLPTPQISSELGHRTINSREDTSDMERSPSPTGSTSAARIRQPLIVESSSESSEVESEEEKVDELRLRREGKRIRGVLPASWLKIDLLARQGQKPASAARERIEKSASPPKSVPRRGVAQRVQRFGTPARTDTILTSDDDDDDGETTAQFQPRMRQARLDFERERPATAAHREPIDDDRMEVDWVDPMFTSAPRKRSAVSGKRRQPRINETFRQPHRPADDFSEERKALKASAREGPGHTRRKLGTKRRRPPVQHHQLSIIDAPPPPDGPSGQLAPFVRLAMRAARKRPDHGRHSPTNKQIRLATREDTEDATATLRAWREGTIVPRRQGQGAASANDYTPTDYNDTREVRSVGTARAPLVELSSNGQGRLPDPLRKEPSAYKAPWKSVATVRRPRTQQTKLTHFVAPLESATTLPQSRSQPSASNANSAAAETMTRVPRKQLRAAQYHDVQLETLESDFDRQHRAAAFERRMQIWTKQASMRAPRQLEAIEYPIARFLNEPTRIETTSTDVTQDTGRSTHDAAVSTARRPLPYRSRKRHAKRIDVETRDYRQPSEPLPEVVVIDDIGGAANVSSTSKPTTVLQGLGPFGTRYATDFDVLPLPLGTYFHESSFIGSGDFVASLAIGTRDLDVSTGRLYLHINGEVLDWGVWTEDVSAGLTLVHNTISGAINSLSHPSQPLEEKDDASLVLANIDYLLRSTVRYIARCLTFLDSVDRSACVQRLDRFVEDLLELFVAEDAETGDKGLIRTRCTQYALVLAKQAVDLCNHTSVHSSFVERCNGLVVRAAHQLAQPLIPRGLVELRQFLEDVRRAAKREAGIRDSDVVVTSIVILRYVLEIKSTARPTFWDVIYEAMDNSVSPLCAVSQLDAVWYNILTILPVLEIKADGIAYIGSCMHGTPEDWVLPRRLLSRVFELYPTTSSVHGSTINDYVRATMVRCYRLTAIWGWWTCESILGTMFDFFARRGLSQLSREESRGSPRFLDELDKTPSLAVQPEDRTFTIFLKLLASSLQGMHKHGLSTDKRIGDVAWRFIPNHGRTYRKDAEVQQEALDALRNHHSLLCTLYYATPPAHRLRVDLIHDLVDHSTSHREACRLNVRAWSNLAAFQMSTTEDVGRLEPFARWYKDMLNTTINQYRLAKTEVERDAAAANSQSKALVPQAVIENTIARNQQQIAATLVDLLAAMKRAMRAANNAASAYYLLDRSNFWQAFGIFEPSGRRLYSMLDEALEVVIFALAVDEKFTTGQESQNTSEDSQDYGDSTALQILASGQPAVRSSDSCLVTVIHAPLAHLISNVFGADESIDDALSTKIIDVWTSAAQAMVSLGQRTMSNYISDYNPEAWTQLRDTVQRRKLTPYFFSRIVESRRVDVLEAGILRSWLTSLVEREAMLKYQNLLTGTLLEHASSEPLLQNLPFVLDASGRYNISLHDFRQRRVSLVSTALSNMRHNFDQALHNRPNMVQGLRRTYADLLKHLMQAMKGNYQDLQVSRSDEIASEQVQRGYAEFVQHVVSAMQQYTSDIQQVDRFFTDSAAFPLPATDPTYVVGRLRSYVPKLAETSKRNQLAIFVQSVSERAAVDNQQGYLVDQLTTAMMGTTERGNTRTPSLRQVLLTAVFPAYIEQALSTAFAWIVARPIIQACGRIASNLLYSVILEDDSSVQGVVDTLSALLQGMTKPLELALAHPGQLRLPQGQAILSAIFTSAQQCLTCVRTLDSHMQDGHPLKRVAERYDVLAKRVEAILTGIDDFDNLDTPDRVPDIPCPWADTMDFSRRQIQDRLSDSWYAIDGQYYVKRGSGPAEVTVALNDDEEERRGLLHSLKDFRQSYQTVFGQGRRSVEARCVDSMLSDLVV